MRTVILIPVMYSAVDLKEFLGSVPSDFVDESRRFWIYVEEKVALAPGDVSLVCLLWNEETVDARARSIVESMETRGAETLRLEDSILLGEARAWLDMSLNVGDLGSKELYEESNRELVQALDMMLDTLADMKTALVFVDPAFKPVFPEGLRVIKMMPLDPEDYLRRHKIRLQLTGKID